ncbi:MULTISPECIES: DUF1127 domain-containing protein [Roseomonadaceae]|uniref:DUF1127 domain-containing protein n=1 Tax=Falsiroseomonas oleicola TaxID=2801474 RepID=A0ABS6HEJ1_9PROT|nr:DUF1127 domain-containing protein [Roseomonas oleicola]MBU8546098.1 DUF1127 domain-containing protein [Roseomonas oleicola]
MQLIKSGQGTDPTFPNVAGAGGAPAITECRRTSRGGAEQNRATGNYPPQALLRVGVLWAERWSQRQHLKSLPDSALKDIGLSRADAFREFSKPFWQG